MHVLIAPDSFGSTMTAVQAAAAMATGWSRTAGGDRLVTCPVSDGGPGFVDVLYDALGGRLLATTVAGPAGDPVPATVLLVPESAEGTGPTAYLESAQACGLHLVPDGADPERLSTVGVGQLLAEAVRAGARSLVVGLGGSATTDGGAGMLSALGAVGTPARALTSGPAGLADLVSVDIDPARALVADVGLAAATDVDNPLTGLRGAASVFGPQKGLAADRLRPVDEILGRWSGLVSGRSPDAARAGLGTRTAGAAGAGAAGGLGFALLELGASRVAGISTVADAVGMSRALESADLVLTGEGAFDYSSRSGKVVSGVAGLAAGAGVPCVVLAGRVELGAREMRTMGVQSAYSMTELVGAERAMTDPAAALADLAQRVARTWARR